MSGISLTVRNAVGLHARPAALFVQTAGRFACDIRVRHGERTVNAKSILGVLSLAVGQGASITIQTEAREVARAILELDSPDAVRALVSERMLAAGGR